MSDGDLASPRRTTSDRDQGREIIIRDATLREGLDVPGVELSTAQRLALIDELEAAGVPEVEIVAPGHFEADIGLAAARGRGGGVRTTGLVYAHGPRFREQIPRASEALDRFELLMPATPLRGPRETAAKVERLAEALALAGEHGAVVGAGFPQATQCPAEVLQALCAAALAGGATRLTIYDTNGGADPDAVGALIGALRPRCGDAELFIHAHDDLGLATAITFAAVRAGADGLDATVNGLGDRAGNCSLEQTALLLHLRGYRTGIELAALRALSRRVARETGVAVAPLAPVVGEHCFAHKSPAHLEDPLLFEAYDPKLVGVERSLVETGEIVDAVAEFARQG